MVLKPEFKQLALRILADAKMLAKSASEQGYRVITGGTDNHLVVIDVLSSGITGVIAEKALEECGIIVNQAEEQRLLKKDYKQLLVNAIVLAISHFCSEGSGKKP